MAPSLSQHSLLLHLGPPCCFPPGGTSGKESSCQCRRHKRRGFNPWVRKIPRSRNWQPTPVFLPGKFHGQWSVVGCSPWGSKESDMTEQQQQQTYSAYILWRESSRSVFLHHTSYPQPMFHVNNFISLSEFAFLFVLSLCSLGWLLKFVLYIP